MSEKMIVTPFWVEHTCDGCGEKFYDVPIYAEDGVFCSKKCAREYMLKVAKCIQ